MVHTDELIPLHVDLNYLSLSMIGNLQDPLTCFVTKVSYFRKDWANHKVASIENGQPWQLATKTHYFLINLSNKIIFIYFQLTPLSLSSPFSSSLRREFTGKWASTLLKSGRTTVNRTSDPSWMPSRAKMPQRSRSFCQINWSILTLSLSPSGEVCCRPPIFYFRIW